MTFWLKGWGWLFEHPRYLWLVLAPLFFAVILATGVIYVMTLVVRPGEWSNQFAGWIEQFLGAPVLLSAIEFFGFWILIFFLVLFFAGAGLILLYAMYLVLCAPFYSLLVEAVLKSEGKINPKTMTFSHWLGLTLKLFGVALMKACIFGVIAMLAFGISFIPGFGLVTLVVAAVIMAFDSMDYSFEIMGLNLRQRFQYFRAEREQLAWMSLSLTLTLLIPGLTLLALPGAVVGAALTVRPETLGKLETEPQL